MQFLNEATVHFADFSRVKMVSICDKFRIEEDGWIEVCCLVYEAIFSFFLL